MTATIVLAGGGTGGHVFPLLAVAGALHELEPELRLVFVGTERGIEKEAVPARGYELELMRVLPMRGSGAFGAVRGAASAVASLSAARALLARHQPKAVFSTGGYVAGPISLAARMLRIPVALCEPNSVMGLANRLIAPLVQRGYVHFTETLRHFPSGVGKELGVPLRAGFSPKPFVRSKGPLSVLVLGGSQGAKTLNERVPEALALLSTPLRVVHQVGKSAEASVRERYARLGVSGVQVVPFIDDMPRALQEAELVIGRSGAGAVAEICAVGRPSVLIPYPFAAGDHQLKNAESLAREGAALCVPAALASPERIAREVRWLLEDGRLERMAERARLRGRPHAARWIAEDFLALAGLSNDDSLGRVA